MNILLDTHMLLWWLNADAQLPKKAKTLISDPSNRIYVSSLSIWEIALKASKGKLDADAKEIKQATLEEGFTLLPFVADTAIETSELPGIHQDPFDRGLIATAQVERITFLTADKLLKGYGSAVLVVK
jgi:PIN domain nuclease of toxin-antitoxin system